MGIFGPTVSDGGALTERESVLVHEEKKIIEAVLAASAGRISGPVGAAVKLGIPRQTLESKIRALRIDKHRFKTS